MNVAFSIRMVFITLYSNGHKSSVQSLTCSWSSPIHYSCTSSFINRTSSPGLNAGSPIYGHPSHLKASPSAQLPQLPTLPCTVKSSSIRSSAPSFAVAGAPLEVAFGPPFALAVAPFLPCSSPSAESAACRFARSSASIFAARPHVQSLQALRRLPALGWHSGAVTGMLARSIIALDASATYVA